MPQLRRCLLALLLALLASSAAHAVDIRLCIRGQSRELGKEFLETRQLRLSLPSFTTDDMVPYIAASVVREKIWPDLKQKEIETAPFNNQTCGNEPEVLAALDYSATEIAAVRDELARGDLGDSPQTQQIVQKAKSAAPEQRAQPPKGQQLVQRFEWLRLYFATDRKPTGKTEAREAFGADRSDTLTFGSVDVSIPSDHHWARLESPSIVRWEWDANPARHIALAPSITPLTKETWVKEIAPRAAGLGKPGVLLFVHGYNTSFEDAARRAAQLAYDLAFAGPVVLFSWPSIDVMSDYARDEQQARNADYDMSEVLAQIVHVSGAEHKVFVVAHSMGNQVFTTGLGHFVNDHPADASAFAQVVLASPDVSAREFRQRWVHVLSNPDMQRRFTLYASSEDFPIRLSAAARGEPRIGSGGDKVTVLPPMTTVDASRITKEWFGLNHSYFADNTTVLSDLALLINQQLPPEHRPRLQPVSLPAGKYWEFKP